MNALKKYIRQHLFQELEENMPIIRHYLVNYSRNLGIELSASLDEALHAYAGLHNNDWGYMPLRDEVVDYFSD